ncbi:UNVERIFIED_CONTAM: hypothetical protein Sradi_4820400, partial [Sesamum radiatum]
GSMHGELQPALLVGSCGGLQVSRHLKRVSEFSNGWESNEQYGARMAPVRHKSGQEVLCECKVAFWAVGNQKQHL